MPAPEPPAARVLRSRIAALLNEPVVAERVRRRLPGRPVAQAPAGLPLCLRKAVRLPPALVQIKAGRCRAVCGGVDCLCGAYPRTLSSEDLSHGPRPEPVAF